MSSFFSGVVFRRCLTDGVSQAVLALDEENRSNPASAPPSVKGEPMEEPVNPEVPMTGGHLALWSTLDERSRKGVRPRTSTSSSSTYGLNLPLLHPLS